MIWLCPMIISTWQSDDPAVSVDPTGTSTGISCDLPGTANITLDYEGAGLITNMTQVTVIDYTVDYVKIRTAIDGGGLDHHTNW